MSVQMERFGLPAGRYVVQLAAVDLLRPARRHGWRLRLTATVLRNGKDVLVFRDLARNGGDPYAVTGQSRKTLRAFAARLGAQDHGPVEEIVAGIRGLAGGQCMAHVRDGKMGMTVMLYRSDPPEHTEKAIAGEVLDAMPPVEPEYRQRTLDAQGAHEQLLAGLHHANRGLALASEAAWRLRRDDGWVALGFDSIGQYLASPEVSMSRSTFYALADIWECYVVKGGQDYQRLVAPSKLEVPLPALREGEVTAGEALADAEALGLRDLRAKYRGEKHERDDGSPAGGLKVRFPAVCVACGVVIADESGVRSGDGIVFGGHRWPEGWSHEQILAATTAAAEVAA